MEVVKEEKKVNAAQDGICFLSHSLQNTTLMLQQDFKPFSPQAVCSASLYSFHAIWAACKPFSQFLPSRLASFQNVWPGF